MNDTPSPTKRIPGFIIFTSILNFVSVSFSALFMALSLLMLVLGSASGFYTAVTQQVSQIIPTTNITLGMNLLFIAIFVISTLLTAFGLAIGIGLLKGKKFAWYAQVTMSVMGLIGFPLWTIINGLILYVFFRQDTRDYFKV